MDIFLGDTPSENQLVSMHLQLIQLHRKCQHCLIMSSLIWWIFLLHWFFRSTFCSGINKILAEGQPCLDSGKLCFLCLLLKGCLLFAMESVYCSRLLKQVFMTSYQLKFIGDRERVTLGVGTRCSSLCFESEFSPRHL